MKHLQESHSGDSYHNMTVVLFTLLCVLICGSLALSPKAQTKTSDEQGVTPNTVPGRNGKIVFTSYRDGGSPEIYTMEADGSNVQRLTNNPGFDLSPKWSPDGSRIAFVSIRDNNVGIYVMNADGSNQTRLTNNPGGDESPEWSPDGTRIVFTSNRGGDNRDIYVINADGSNQTRLTNSPGIDGSPRWSPDGTRIVFHRISSSVPGDIYVMNADGSNQRQLINSGYSPRWSPDSSRIAFQSYRHGNSEIYVINADGSNQTRLTNNPEDDESPEWSPDGTRIVFQSTRGNDYEIYVMNADGTNQTRLTNNPAEHYGAPIFSPDGTRIAFRSGVFSVFDEAIRSTQIYVMNADGSNPVRLTNTAAGVYNSGLDWQALSLTSPSCPNPIDCAEFFVRQHYLDFLSREPEAGEPWTAVLSRCGDIYTGPAVNTDCDRIAVSGSFFRSPEFQLKGLYVFRFYRLAFNRLPEYAEINPDMSFVAGATAAEVFARKAQLAAQFTGRQEFQTAYGNLSNADFVSALLNRYQLARITTPDPANPDGTQKVTLTSADLINRLNGSGGTLTRAQVFRAIADSDEVGGAEYNNAFVAMQYYGYLRRTPEAEGYQAWLRVINQNPNDIRLMVNGFINSQEYRRRFGQP